MRTVKQVSDLTGISVRMLHHYDKIGLLKPTKLTQAGYRLYDDEALETLQQILFFKELDFQLNEIKDIITNPHFDKMKALENHKKLIILKRDRLNGLIELINKTLKGANTMSFNEFDMTEYYNVLEEFKKENTDKIIKMWGSIDKYDDIISKVKTEEEKIATMAIKQYGSIEKYAKAIKENLNNSLMLTKAEEMDRFKEDCLCDNNPKLKELYKELTTDLSKDISSKDIQQIVTDITNIAKNNYEIFSGDMGDSYWHSMVQLYLVFPDWIEKVDKKYGSGASKFIGEALKWNLGDYEPKLETSYKKLTSDLSKSSSAEEIQRIILEIVEETQRQHDYLKVEIGENYWSYQSEQYCSDLNLIKVMDDKYGSGSSKFIGEALKFYVESND
ncbi:MerR family transcriptional regulator [Terrisporobacter vanillatitrophus]|uniref:MerR family transcriptional regulator n=1 Tax=Terrisporobacter vanillatitrophus TaxID=3058402 RepID=UPI003367F126